MSEEIQQLREEMSSRFNSLGQKIERLDQRMDNWANHNTNSAKDLGMIEGKIAVIGSLGVVLLGGLGAGLVELIKHFMGK